jgi:hypothetical protein
LLWCGLRNVRFHPILGRSEMCPEADSWPVMTEATKSLVSPARSVHHCVDQPSGSPTYVFD